MTDVRKRNPDRALQRATGTKVDHSPQNNLPQIYAICSDLQTRHLRCRFGLPASQARLVAGLFFRGGHAMICNTLQDPYARATRMLDYALILGDDPEVWNWLALILELRLSRGERARLLKAAISCAHPDDTKSAISDVLPDMLAGSPMPVLIDIGDDARWWADLAALPELKAWLAACFVRLPQRDQQEFLASAMRRVAA